MIGPPEPAARIEARDITSTVGYRFTPVADQPSTWIEISRSSAAPDRRRPFARSRRPGHPERHRHRFRSSTSSWSMWKTPPAHASSFCGSPGRIRTGRRSRRTPRRSASASSPRPATSSSSSRSTPPSRRGVLGEHRLARRGRRRRDDARGRVVEGRSPHSRCTPTSCTSPETSPSALPSASCSRRAWATAWRGSRSSDRWDRKLAQRVGAAAVAHVDRRIDRGLRRSGRAGRA